MLQSFFHTGLLVVKPSVKRFNELLTGMSMTWHVVVT